MIYKVVLVITSIFTISSYVNISNNNKTTHNHTYEHTSKLSKNIDLKFVSQSSLIVTLKDQTIESFNLELIHHDQDGHKTTLLNQIISESQILDLEHLTSDIEAGTLAAILKGEDKNNQPISKVSTYDIKYQLEINDAKKRRKLSH